MSENIFWTTVATHAAHTRIKEIQEIEFLISELKQNASTDDKARCLRECISRDTVLNKETRHILIKLLQKEGIERLSEISGIQVESLLDSGYELREAERRRLEDILYSGANAYCDAERERYCPPEVLEFGYNLFGHQKDMAERIIDHTRSGTRGCIVHMPTGSGKTRTAMWTICKLITAYNKRCCWITYNKTLITQAVSEFEKAWSYKGDDSCRIGYLTGEWESESVENSNIIFASFGKLSIDARTDERSVIKKIAENTDIIFIDEAHEAQAEGRGIALRAITFLNSNIKLVGLTATPGKSPDGYNDSDYELAEHFEDNKLLLEISGYKNPINYLLDAGYLAKPSYFKIEDHWGNDTLVEINEIVQKVLASSIKHKKIVVFCSSVRVSRICASLCGIGGIRCFHLDGSTPEPERARIRETFNLNNDKAECLALFNCNVLATGFDAPKTTLVLIFRKVVSVVLLSQMIGRGLRGPRAGGTDAVEVGLMIDEQDAESLSVASMFMNWEHLWATK